jgi:hypothetical protein
MLFQNKKWTAITGVRYRNNSLLVNSKILKLILIAFADIQTNINYEASAKWQWSFLGNISQNKYQYQPLTSNQFRYNWPAIDAFLFFMKDKKRTNMILTLGQWKLHLEATPLLHWNLSVPFSYFGARAFWYFCSIPLGGVDSNIGSETWWCCFHQRGGSQLNHARNDLDALIVKCWSKGFHDWRKKRNRMGSQIYSWIDSRSSCGMGSNRLGWVLYQSTNF